MPSSASPPQRESMLESFPWDYLSSHSESTGDAVVRWIYSHFSGRAYQGFVEQGRGLLVGPFLTGDDKNVIDSTEFLERQAAGNTSGRQRGYGEESPESQGARQSGFVRT